MQDISQRTHQSSISNNNYNPGALTCCCINQQSSCLSGLTQGGGGDDLVGLGLIDERIVNRPGAGNQGQGTSCPVGQRQCCYSDARLSGCPGGSSEFGNNNNGNQVWRQGCQESTSFSQCGQRSYSGTQTKEISVSIIYVHML